MKNKLILLALLSSLGTYGTAQAKSTIGGIVFTNAFYSDIDDGMTSVSSTNIELANNSRLRVRWDNEDNVGMYIEAAVGSDIKLRHAYGTFKISEKWQILAGQTSTPFAPLNPDVAMVNNSGQSVGSVSPGRQAQIRFTRKFLNKKGAWAIAFVDPNNGDDPDDAVVGGDLGDKSSELPRIDIGAAFRSYNWQLFPSAFYQKQSYSNLTTTGSEDEIESWGAAFGLKRGFGPVVLSAEYGAGQNWGNTKMSISGSPAGNNSAASIINDGGINRIADTDNTGFWLDLGFRFTGKETKGTVHVIAGELTSEVDQLGISYASSMAGISVPIDLPWIARGFRIRPEAFVFDYGDNTVLTGGGLRNVDSGTETIVGVQLQYTF